MRMNSSHETKLHLLFRMKGEIYQEADLNICLKNLKLQENMNISMTSYYLRQSKVQKQLMIMIFMDEKSKRQMHWERLFF